MNTSHVIKSQLNDKLFLLASVVVDHHHHYHASILFAPCGTYGLGSIKDHAVCTHPTHLLEKTSLHAVDGYNLNMLPFSDCVHVHVH